MAISATVKNRHWNEWKRIKRFLLYGASTRKMMAGINVTYASMPATLSVKPAAGTAAAAGPPETRLAQAGQVLTPSGICAPHVLQNAMEPPMSCRFRVRGRVRGKVTKTTLQSNEIPELILEFSCVALSEISQIRHFERLPPPRFGH